MLPSASTRNIRHASRLPDDDVASGLDDILLTSVTWEEHLTSTKKVLGQLLAAKCSFNFTKCIFVAVRQEFLGVSIDSTGIRPTPF